MKNQLTVESVMTVCPHTIAIDDSIASARHKLREYGIRHLPVMDGAHLVGLISDRDIKFAEGIDKNLEIADVLIREPYVVQPQTALQQVVSKMAAEKIGCTLVLKDTKVVGIYTAVDACRDLAELLKQQESV